jgi:hypothetical protein
VPVLRIHACLRSGPTCEYPSIDARGLRAAGAVGRALHSEHLHAVEERDREPREVVVVGGEDEIAAAGGGGNDHGVDERRARHRSDCFTRQACEG